MRLLSVMLGAFLSVPLFVGASVLTDVEMAATPLSPPPGSPLDIQQQGELEIKRLEDTALAELHAPLPVAFVDREDSVQNSRLKEYKEAKNWISIVEQKLSRQVSQEEWKIEKETKKRDDESPEQWVDRITKKYGVFPHPATQVIVSDKMACDQGKDNISGCVGQDTFAGHPTALNMQMYLTHDAIGDVYVLFHEIAHTHGILDECSADDYSRSITGLPGGHYC